MPKRFGREFLRLRFGAQVLAPSGAHSSELQAARQKRGEDTERDVGSALRSLGYRLVEKSEVSFGLRKGERAGEQKRFARGKVSGDFRAVENRSGRSVLVESKACDGGRLPHGKFRRHQLDALEEHHMAGALSMVAWTDVDVLRLIPWTAFRRVGFEAGTSVEFVPDPPPVLRMDDNGRPFWVGGSVQVYMRQPTTKPKKGRTP